MKKILILILFTGLIALVAPSCFDDYLDRAPESGLTEEEVFSKLANFKQFFYAVYDGRKYFDGGWRDYNLRLGSTLYFSFWDQKYSWETLTDAADLGRQMEGHSFKSGQVSAFINKFTYDGKRRPILESLFMCIRVSNTAIKNIDLIQDATQQDKDDLLGQAHFVRAFSHFELMRIWGPMPYIRHVIGPDDQWDIPRLSKYETLANIALDMDSAAMYFGKADLMRRDAKPGEPGHLNHPDQKRATGVAAKAYKSRALLYAASPLNNDKGQKAWEDAAKASWEAIQIAEQHGYALLTAANYKRNFTGNDYSNEQLWAYAAGNTAWNSGNLAGIAAGIFGNSLTSWSGVFPTQNFVDKYETKWGEPLNTEADRQAAAAAGHYNEQNPYKDRDPRLTIDVIYNQTNLVGYGKAEIWYEMKSGIPTYSQLLDPKFNGRSFTGYILRKTWGEHSDKNRTSVRYTDPLIRLAELYLNYAEAANEAYGPNTPAPGASMTAVDAVNVIRARISMVPVQAKYTANKEIFRDRIKNERNIELSFEGHYYFDIRRWKDAPVTMAGPLFGVDIEKVAVSAQYPTGFRYTRRPLDANRQSRWKDAMYYLPFNTEDNFKMNNFVPNEVW